MEADLQEVYGVQLGDLYTGALTPRRCWLLIEQLPRGSRTAMAMGGDGAWGTEAHLLASLLTAIRSDLAGKRVKSPEPPESGWRAKQREQQARMDRKAARYRRQAKK